MLLGRAIERVDMTVRLLLSRVGITSPACDAAALGGCADTQFRQHLPRCAGRGPSYDARPAFPRSVFHSLKLRNLAELRTTAAIGTSRMAEVVERKKHQRAEPVQPGVLLGRPGEPPGGLQNYRALATQWQPCTFTQLPVAWFDAASANSSEAKENPEQEPGWCTPPIYHQSPVIHATESA